MSDLPGGVITTHCVSTVVRPGSKQNHDPLQFVKIQSTELSQKAVEQIRLAEAVKITKEKIKEVEEEWQNNLLNWKSKRRQSRLTGGEESDSGDNQQRKIKTFSEILNEKAKSGQRIGYNLHKYIGMQDEEEEENLVITNNNNNNNDKRGSSRFSNGKNGSGDYLEDDDSNQFKNYEQQQAELQKKRQELNNKLQELEQLEKKQNELERQERINSPSSEISSPSPQLSSNTSETARNDSPTVIVSIENKERQSNLSTANVAKNCEIKQKQNDGYSDKKVFNFNSSSSELTKREEYNSVSSAHENRQKSVWNYLLQQQDDPRVVHHSHIDPNSDMNQPNLRPNSQYINADSESDDDHLNDSMDADEAAEKEQMLSFRAKLSTFESLSKSDASAQQQPSKQVKKSEKVKRTADQITSRLFPTTTSANSCSPSSSQTSSCTTLSAAATPTVSIQNLKDLENNSVIKNRPPTVEDLAHKEEMKVLQQRLQNQNIGEQQKHFHSTQQPTLPVNSINQNSHQKLHPIQQQANLDKSWNQNSPSHLPLNQMSKVCNPQVNNSNNSLVHPHQQHHYHSRTSSEETRESSSTWETSNFVCDKEVEKISERMNRGNVIPAEFGGNGHETITSTSVHYNNSGLPGLPATSMNQHYHSSSHLSHPHLLQQQRSQYAYDQVKMNRHSVPNLNGPGRGYDQQQYYLMNEIIGDNQQMLANNNGNVNNTHNPVANNNSNMNNNNNFTINNNIINSNGNNSNLNNGNNVNTTEDNYYSNQEQIDLIKKQMMLQKQNSYLNESTASYMQHASKSQSNLNGAQISNLSGQQQQPSELTTSPTYLPIHQQRAVNQSLLRYHQHQYQASINPPMQPMSHSVHSGLPQQSQKQANLQQQSDQQQLYSNYSAAHHMGKSQSTPNMSCQLTNQLQPQAQQCSPYNINHWVIQEAELRRLHYTQQQGPALMARSTAINKFPQPSQVNPNAGNTYENHVYENSPFRGSNASGLNRIPNHPAADTMLKKSNGLQVTQTPIQTVQQGQPQPQPTQQSQQQSPSHGPLQLAQPLQSQQLHQQQQQQKQMLSVSGKKKCSNCGDELGRGCAAMVIETLALYYHINCFRCSVCHIQLGNGTCGTDVRVRNHKLHCHNCYSNDEAGLKFSRV